MMYTFLFFFIILISVLILTLLCQIAHDMENMELYFPMLANLVMSVESIREKYDIL